MNELIVSPDGKHIAVLDPAKSQFILPIGPSRLRFAACNIALRVTSLPIAITMNRTKKSWSDTRPTYEENHVVTIKSPLLLGAIKVAKRTLWTEFAVNFHTCDTSDSFEPCRSKDLPPRMCRRYLLRN